MSGCRFVTAQQSVGPGKEKSFDYHRSQQKRDHGIPLPAGLCGGGENLLAPL
jgi:hypothetical protein